MSNEKREQQMMDASDRYADEVCDGSCTGAQVADTINDFCAGWRAADSHPNWISVEERLPEVGEKVIFYSPRIDDWLSGALQQDGRWWCEEYGTHFYDVTHWMEIVPPRKEE